MIRRRAITNRADWLRWRRDFLCASEVAAAAGIDVYRSPLSLVAEKMGIVTVSENAPMRRGRHFEAAAVSYLVEEYGDEYFINRGHAFLMDDEWRLACTPDALLTHRQTGELVNCQIKTIARPVFDSWNGVPPAGYCLQTACENMLTGSDRGMLAVLVVGTYDAELVCFDIPRHEAAEQRIRELAQVFWQNLADGRVPAFDYRRDGEAISAMFSKAEEGPPLDLSADNRLAAILPEREAVKTRIKLDTERLAELDNELKAKLGHSETAIYPGWRITYRETTRKPYTVAGTTYRALSVKPAKEP